MANQLVTFLHTATGEISPNLPAKWFGTIISDKAYVIVQDGTKPYVKRTYKPRTPKMFTRDHPEKVVDQYPSDTEETF